ncbi:hypothetical protein BDW74DRAFT_142328 [Aspergillus multicolor]|uniref:uncharacterized protein n=1 Tax=Aspergillus multicolor TaxID=41759 RepID=UPI003CCD5650
MPLPHSTSSRSFSSSSFSTTTSESAPSSSAIPVRTPSTLRLKRWLSTHLQLPLPRQGSGHDTDTTLNHDLPHYTLENNAAKASNTNTNTDTDFSQSDSQPSSTIKIPHDLSLSISASQHHFTDFDYDYENPASGYGSGYGLDGPHRHRVHRHNQYVADLGNGSQAGRFGNADEEEEDLVLADNYAAFCRAFTSSPVHFHNTPARPLPRLPTSETWADYQNSLAPETIDAPPERVSQISFLPLGAHGYHPSSWVLPRPPSPPPGILTPARYEIQQQREMEKLEKDKQKRKRQHLTRCLPIRFSWWPWSRAHHVA